MLFSYVIKVIVLHAILKLALANTIKYKLKYFDAKGAAELSRVLFKIGGIDFEDYRYKILRNENGGFDTPEYNELKEQGEFSSNMNRVPILEINDTNKYGQSRAIEKYIAKKCELYGDNAEEELSIDNIIENVRDIKDQWGKVRFTGGMGVSEEKEKAINKWYSNDLIDWLKKLESSLPTAVDDESIAVGRRISYADVSIWHLLRDYFSDSKAVAECEKLAQCVRLTKICDRVSQLSALKQWLSERPDTIM